MTDSAAQQLSIPEGSDLVESLQRAANTADGWVLASGLVERVELRVAGQGAGSVRAVDQAATLASLSGPVGGPYQVVVAQPTSSGFEIAAGALVRARVLQVDAVWLPIGTPVDGSESAGAQPGAGAPQRPLEPPPGARWAAIAAAAAQAAQQDEREERAHRPQPGDLVQHFAFGLCDVLKSSGDTLTIRDVRGPARIREIRIDMLDVHPPSRHEGKRLFQLARKR
jgi:hypothetical protein